MLHQEPAVVLVQVQGSPVGLTVGTWIMPSGALRPTVATAECVDILMALVWKRKVACVFLLQKSKYKTV
jgi:hypothetical protein